MLVMAKPSVIHFGGFEVDKKHTVSLSIVNVSTEVIRMHIVPPQSKYFYVKYTKNVSYFYIHYSFIHCDSIITGYYIPQTPL